MSVTVTSVLSLVFWGNLIIIGVYIISRIPSVFNKTNCHFMIWLLCLTFLRFLFPGEFKYSISIRISHTFQEIMKFVYLYPISILGYSIYIYQILLAIWLSVAFILLMRIIRKYMRFRLSVNQLLHSPYTSSIEKPQDCDFPKSVELYESSLISAPLITGIFKPVIVMPALSLSSKELSYVVQHELQHYKYRDLLLKMFMELFCILYWWNPVMHLLKKQLLLLLEMRADTEVYEPLTNTEKIDYLGCLKKLCSCQSKDSLFEAKFAEADKKSVILKRAEYLTQESNSKPPIIASVLFSFLLLCSIVLIIEPAASTGPPDGTFTLPEDSYIVQTLDGTYELYFGEDFIAFLNDPYTDGLDTLTIYKNSREGEVIRKHEKEIPIVIFTTPVLFGLLFITCICPELRRRNKLYQ